ncbi:MAG TPA: BsuPI-related putative proteinase inhibitor [Gemmatimonadaceae bacterium]
MNLIRRTVLGLVVLSLGCKATTTSPSSTMIGANLVRLSVSSSASEVVRGTPVTLQVKLSNEGSAPVTLHFSDSCQINPYIQNSAGQTVLPEGGSRGCLTVITDLTVTPGNDVVREFVWTGSTAFQSEMPLRPLPAGRYFFTAEVPANEVVLQAMLPLILK